MATYLQSYATAVDTDFTRRVAIAAVDYCRTVVAETAATANHANRIALMRQVASDPTTWGTRLAYGVAMLGGTMVSTDPQILSFVGTLWDAYSGLAP